MHEARPDHRCSGSNGPSPQRHAGCRSYASGQTKAVLQLSPSEECMIAEGRGNAGLMDNEENQRQVSLVAHSPWKSQTARFPHSPRPAHPWKSGKPKAGFPLSHWLPFSLKPKPKKGGPAADRFAPASRLILQLENAGTSEFEESKNPRIRGMRWLRGFLEFLNS